MAALWNKKKEVHPLLLQKTKHVNFSKSVSVQEFSEEQHPSAVFKIKLSLSSSSECSSLLTESEETSSLQADSTCSDSYAECSDEQSSLDIEDNSDEGIQVFTELESRLVLSDAEDWDQDEDDNEKCFLKLSQKDESSTSGKRDRQNGVSKVESYKIKWSCKRKKKNKLSLHTPQRSRKMIFLGDMSSGKSNLITTYCRDRFTEDHQPTILHCCLSDARVFGRKIPLILVDTPGRDDFKPLRRCSYHNTDVAILCYSAGDRVTLERIKSYWLPELNEHVRNCPFVIVETKKDIREEYEDKKNLLKKDGKIGTLEYDKVCEDLEERIVPEEMGAKLAEDLGAGGFFTTSARYRMGTRELFQEVTKLALKKSRRKRQL